MKPITLQAATETGRPSLTGINQLTTAAKRGPHLGKYSRHSFSKAPPVITGQQSQTPLHLDGYTEPHTLNCFSWSSFKNAASL